MITRNNDAIELIPTVSRIIRIAPYAFTHVIVGHFGATIFISFSPSVHVPSLQTVGTGPKQRCDR